MFNGIAHKMYGSGLFQNTIIPVNNPNEVPDAGVFGPGGLGPGTARPIGFYGYQLVNIMFDVHKWKTICNIDDSNITNISGARGVIPNNQASLLAGQAAGLGVLGINFYKNEVNLSIASSIDLFSQLYNYQNKYYPIASCGGGVCPSTSDSITVTFNGIVNEFPSEYSGEPNGERICTFLSETSETRTWTVQFTDGEWVPHGIPTVFEVRVVCLGGGFFVTIDMYLEIVDDGHFIDRIFGATVPISNQSFDNDAISSWYSGGTVTVGSNPDSGIANSIKNSITSSQIGKFSILGVEAPLYGNLPVTLNVLPDLSQQDVYWGS